MKIFEKIVIGSWFYGGFLGFLAPFIYTLVVIAAAPDFRAIYYLRFFLAIVLGAFIGGFSASRFTKYGLKIIKPNFPSYLIFGFLFGAISGLLTYGVPALMFLISSTNITWAVNTLVRSSILGGILGSLAGIFFGFCTYSYLKQQKKKRR